MRRGGAVVLIGALTGKEPQFRGVRKCPRGRFAVEIRDPWKKTRMWLSTFDSTEDAACAYGATAHALGYTKAKTNTIQTPAPRCLPLAPDLYHIDCDSSSFVVDEDDARSTTQRKASPLVFDLNLPPPSNDLDVDLYNTAVCL